MTPEKRQAVWEQLTDEDAEALRHDWRLWARPTQLPPAEAQGGEPDWTFWLFLAGRGAGKTRAGAEWVRERVKQGARRIHLIAPTQADARKVMVEGPSGLLSVCWQYDETYDHQFLGRPSFEPSFFQVTWANGAQAHYFSAEVPQRLRGPECDTLWADELAAWENLDDTWDMAMFGFRVGDDLRCLVTTTPKPLPRVRALVADPATAITRDTTYANRVNLAPKFFQQVVSKYEGTRLGRQELQGEILEDVEGALWRRDMILYADEVRGFPILDRRDGQRRIVWSNGGSTPLLRVGVAIDPQAGNNENSAATGIVGMGIGLDGRLYVLADRSGRKSPLEWALTAVALYDELDADFMVGEGNQGGEMVRYTVQSVRSNVPVEIVHASRSKQARAEPVAALYEQKMVIHVEPFPELEDELVTWEPLTGKPSPDRLDAMVWAATKLALGQGELILGGVPDEAIYARG